MNQLLQKEIQSLVYFVFLFNLYITSNTCEKNDIILKDILKVERNYIDKGSFGQVWGNDEFVSKTIKAKQGIELEILNNELKVMIAFSQEIDLMGLKKDNCYYENLDNFGTGYRVKLKMDKMESNLKTAIQINNIDDAWKLDIIFQICIAIKKLHDKNILHLDLKEQNIMLLDNYTPVIADFGFALLPNQTRNFTCGTPLFMAPEIYKLKYEKAADIYALGIIFFQILKQKFIYQKESIKRCSKKERNLNSLYCMAENIILLMISNKYKQRPDIDSIIIKFSDLIRIFYKKKQNELLEYMDRQISHYNSQNLSKVVEKYKDQLIERAKQRKEIYQMFLNKEKTQKLMDQINIYAQPKQDPLLFLSKYNQKFDIIGHQVIQSNEDLYSSLLSIKQKMEESQIDRNKGIDINSQLIDDSGQSPIEDQSDQINDGAIDEDQEYKAQSNQGLDDSFQLPEVSDENVQINKIPQLQYQQNFIFAYKNPLDNQIIDFGPLKVNLEDIKQQKNQQLLTRKNSIQPQIKLADRLNLVNQNNNKPMYNGIQINNYQWQPNMQNMISDQQTQQRKRIPIFDNNYVFQGVNNEKTTIQNNQKKLDFNLDKSQATFNNMQNRKKIFV